MVGSDLSPSSKISNSTGMGQEVRHDALIKTKAMGTWERKHDDFSLISEKPKHSEKPKLKTERRGLEEKA